MTCPCCTVRPGPGQRPGRGAGRPRSALQQRSHRRRQQQNETPQTPDLRTRRLRVAPPTNPAQLTSTKPNTTGYENLVRADELTQPRIWMRLCWAAWRAGYAARRTEDTLELPVELPTGSRT